MTKLKITFGRPKNVGNPEHDVVMIRFPFTVCRSGEDALQDIVTEHEVDVVLAVSDLGNLGFKCELAPVNYLENQSLIKTFFECGLKEVKSKLTSGTLNKNNKVTFMHENTLSGNPYDPAKIPDPDGFSFQLELPQRPIGFRVPGI